MPTISRMNHCDGSPVRNARTKTYSDRLTLVSAASLWMSQNSNGPKKFQFGPRRNVPRTISEHHSTTMTSEGRTTPPSHGSKYTSISCSPRKYHGAFDGFGVLAGFAGCSSGAFRKIDQTISTTEHRISEMSSV